MLAGGAALGLLLVLGAVYVVVAHPFRGPRTDLVTHKVQYGRLELTIVERGFLESAKNTDIVCRVKARAQTSQTSTTIKWVIDEGTRVVRDRPLNEVRSIVVWDDATASYIEKPGSPDGTARVMEIQSAKTGRKRYADLLVELDESGLQDQLKDQKIVVDKAESDWIQAQQQYRIDEEQYLSDKKTAETKLQLAKIDLDKYLKGDYPQALMTIEGKIKQDESDVEQQRDRSAWAQRMLKKGYYTISQSDSELSKLQSLELNLANDREQRRVLIDPEYGTKKRTETDDRNTIAVAEASLRQVEQKWVATKVKDEKDRDTKKSVYDQGVGKFNEIKDEIKKCKLAAPQDGLVVYYIAEQTRWGVGRQAVIAQSEAVAENQKLMQIPDLAHMFVNTKVHEALVSRVHASQPATIRVDAAADRKLKGHIESVANTASQQDFFAADVKVYATKVMIDEELEGLKPGMQAEVTITIADALEHVLTVPIESVIGSAESGKTRTCYVMTSNGPEARRIVVGENNDKLVEVKDPKETASILRKAGWTDEQLAEMKLGISEGDEVVLNPRAIVGEKAKVHQPGSLNTGGEGEGQSSAPGNGTKNGRGGRGAGPEANGAAGPRPGPAMGGNEGGRGGPAGGPGAGGAQPSPEQMKEMRKKLVADFKALTPEKRKERLQQIPEQWRDNVRKALKDENIEVPD